MQLLVLNCQYLLSHSISLLLLRASLKDRLLGIFIGWLILRPSFVLGKKQNVLNVLRHPYINIQVWRIYKHYAVWKFTNWWYQINKLTYKYSIYDERVKFLKWLVFVVLTVNCLLLDTAPGWFLDLAQDTIVQAMGDD